MSPNDGRIEHMMDMVEKYDIKPVHVMQLPQARNRAYAGDIWYEECKLLKEELEQRFDVEITDEALREAARKRNRVRRAMMDLYNLQQNEPPAMSGVELMASLLRATFSFDVDSYAQTLEDLAEQRRSAYEAGERPVPASAKRIMITAALRAASSRRWAYRRGAPAA